MCGWWWGEWEGREGRQDWLSMAEWARQSLCKAEGEWESFSPKSPLLPPFPDPLLPQSTPLPAPGEPALGPAARDALGIEVILSSSP